MHVFLQQVVVVILVLVALALMVGLTYFMYVLIPRMLYAHSHGVDIGHMSDENEKELEEKLKQAFLNSPPGQIGM